MLLIPFTFISSKDAPKQSQSEAALFDGQNWVSDELESFLYKLGGDIVELDKKLEDDKKLDDASVYREKARDTI